MSRTIRTTIIAPLCRTHVLSETLCESVTYGIFGRDTYASLLLAAGKELHYIQQQLGHHSPAFTLAVYGHLLPRDRRNEVNCLDDAAPGGTPVARTRRPATAAKKTKAREVA